MNVPFFSNIHTAVCLQILKKQVQMTEESERKRKQRAISQIIGEPVKQEDIYLTFQERFNESLRMLPSPTSLNLPCIICFKNQSGHFTQCQHATFCLFCAENYLNSCELGSSPKCGIVSCSAPMSEEKDSLYWHFGEETKKRWRVGLSNKIMKRNSKEGDVFRECQYPDCNGRVHPETHRCSFCENRHCSRCHRLDHEGQCLGNSFVPGEIEYKVCQLCKGKIYKEGGCAKVTCFTCHRQVCYECGEAWSHIHHGCAPGGWIKLPWYFLVDKCCSDSTVNREDEIMI